MGGRVAKDAVEQTVDVEDVVTVDVEVGIEMTCAGKTKERAARSRSFLNAIFKILD